MVSSEIRQQIAASLRRQPRPSDREVARDHGVARGTVALIRSEEGLDPMPRGRPRTPSLELIADSLQREPLQSDRLLARRFRVARETVARIRQEEGLQRSGYVYDVCTRDGEDGERLGTVELQVHARFPVRGDKVYRREWEEAHHIITMEFPTEVRGAGLGGLADALEQLASKALRDRPLRADWQRSRSG
jgi:hypothetical protein